MSEEAHNELSETNVGEIARQEFGLQEEQPSRPRSLTVDNAYEELQESKDRASDEAALAEQDDEPEQSEPAAEETEDGALWTNEDVETVAFLQQESARFQQDLAAFAQAKQVDLNEIAKKDKPRAAALRTQMHEAEHELRQRYEALSQLQQELQQKAAGQQAKQTRKILQREKEKLLGVLPDIDGTALRKYLTKSLGFKKDEVEQVADHRLLVMAEKARRYDEMTDKKGKKQPKFKKGAKRKKQDTSEWREAMDEINRTGITKHNAHRVLHSPAPKKREPTVAELRRKLKKTGSMADARALLQAKRRAQA